MKKRIICICMAALLSLSLLAGCGAEGNTDTEQDAAAQAVTVRLSEVTHSVFYAPQYVAMSQGFFADEGLDIDLSNGGGADKVMSSPAARISGWQGRRAASISTGRARTICRSSSPS